MKRVLFTLALVGASLAAIPAYAHHSFAATYFEDKTVTIQGKLVQFMFRNPHSFVHVEAPDDSGKMETWAIEWGGGGQLAREGVNRDTLKPGDLVKITDGPFKDYDGKIAEVNEERGSVKVLVPIFGRDTAVELDSLQVKKV